MLGEVIGERRRWQSYAKPLLCKAKDRYGVHVMVKYIPRY